MVRNSTSTLSESAYERLKHDIIHGALAPGMRLAVKQLSDRYAIGASPIREALARLAGEGLVQVFGQRGFRVPPINLADLQDVTATRTLIECEALRQSIAAGDDHWESTVVASHYQLQKFEQGQAHDFALWEHRNQSFHDALVAACPSPWLARLRITLYDQHRRYRFLSTQFAPSRDVAGEHQALCDAALARDAATAVEVLRVHVERTAQTVKQVLDTGGAPLHVDIRSQSNSL